MARSPIEIDRFIMSPFLQWDKHWFVLSTGNLADNAFNAMTVSWGSLGIMWHRPFVQVVVRPVRYTYELMEGCETFTLNAFPEAYRPALQLLGSVSGRNTDKIAQSGLTPIPSENVTAPGYAEAELIVECRKIYLDDLRPEGFLDPSIENNYPRRDYHRSYYGEVLGITGEAWYRRAS